MFELLAFLRLFYFVKKRLLLGILLGLLTLVAGIGLLALSGWFISAAAYTGMVATVAIGFNYFLPSAGVRFFAMLRIAARYGERVINHDTTFKLLTFMRVWCYQLLDPIAPGFLARRRRSDFLNRMVTDVNAMDSLYLRIVSPFLLALLVAVLLWCFLQFYSVLLADQVILILLVAIVGLPIFALYLGKNISARLIQLIREMHTQAIESIQGLAELLIFSSLRRQMDVLMANQERLLSLQQRMVLVRGLFHSLVICFSGGSMCLALFIGSGLVYQNQLDGANLALIVLAVLAAYEAVLPLPVAFQYLGQTMSAARRLNEVKQHAPEILFPARSEVLPSDYSILFQDIAFSYDSNQPIFTRFNLSVQSGQHLAILGQTGSGKTSILKLLARFILPNSGSISIGGVPLALLSEQDLRGIVSILEQKAHIFANTIRQNLLIARPEATEADLWRVLSDVLLDDLVKTLPDGLDTWLGEFGTGLSGGQLQRLALARIFLHDGPIWVLDEPTEGLDPVTEKKVIEKILAASQDKTVLWITHKPTAISSHMDQMVYIADHFIQD